jgi:hypothetical protein
MAEAVAECDLDYGQDTGGNDRSKRGQSPRRFVTDRCASVGLSGGPPSPALARRRNSFG